MAGVAHPESEFDLVGNARQGHDSNWIQRDRSRRATVVGLVKQQQLHTSIASRENAEIHAARIHGGTERKTLTGRNYGVHPP